MHNHAHAHAWPMHGPCNMGGRALHSALSGTCQQLVGCRCMVWGQAEARGDRLPVLLPQEGPQISDTATYPPPPKQDVAPAAPRSVPVAELVGKEDGERRRRKKSEGEKKGASPRMGDAQGAEKGTQNDGEAMLISGHHAAGSQAP